MNNIHPPSSSEYHKGDHVEGAVAVILTVRIGELDHMDFVLVAETCSEVVQLLLANQRVQGVGANSMPETQGYFQLHQLALKRESHLKTHQVTGTIHITMATMSMMSYITLQPNSQKQPATSSQQV